MTQQDERLTNAQVRELEAADFDRMAEHGRVVLHVWLDSNAPGALELIRAIDAVDHLDAARQFRGSSTTPAERRAIERLGAAVTALGGNWPPPPDDTVDDDTEESE